MIAVDLAKSLRRRRTLGMGIVLAFLGVLPTLIALGGGGHERGGGPPFFEFVKSNGLFAPLTALAITSGFFMPLMVSLVAGDAIAGEASNGTLRVLLVRPVPRTRLVISKFMSTAIQVGMLVLWLTIAALIAGIIAFGAHGMPTLSGQVLSTGSGVLRILASAAFLGIGMLGLAAFGLFISALTDSGPGATVVTIGFAIVSQILDNISAVRWIQPYLVVHRWLAFADLFRSPVEWSAILNGLLVFAVYVAIFFTGAVVLFRRKDIQS